MLFKLILAFISALAAIGQTSAATDKVVCYYASWSVYRNGNGKTSPDKIDPSVCTHVIYTFLGVEATGELKSVDAWADIDLGGFRKVNSLKQINPKLKTLVSIGGWNAGNAILAGIIPSSKLRSNFIESAVKLFTTHGFDGLDIDWEYPNNNDKANFVILLQELRAAFDKGKYTLSVTVAANVLSSYDAPNISKYADIVSIMTYDYHTTGDGVTGHNSPLYPGKIGANTGNVNASVSAWLAAGISSDKLLLSIPFYGHSFLLDNPLKSDIGSSAKPGIAGPYTAAPGTLGYNEICELYDDWKVFWDDEQKVPYKLNSANWVSYDDAQSISVKVKYAVDRKLGGVAVWTVDTDDFTGKCGSAKNLLKAIKDNLPHSN